MAERKSRGCALLGALGRLYERCHLLLGVSELPETARDTQSMREVLARLLSPFSWLRPLLLRLVESHRLHDVPPPVKNLCILPLIAQTLHTETSWSEQVDAPKIAKALALLTPIPEGVPPVQLGSEPEPEP